MCYSGSYNIFDLWNVQIVNVTGSVRVSSYTVDSPDSSSIRLVTYLLGKWTGRWNYNMNSFYNHEYVKKDNTEQFLLSPYGHSCFNFSCPTREKQGMSIRVLRYKAFDEFCLLRLLIGTAILLLSSKLSRSKSFYYISAATLSAVIGLLLVIFYVMKRMQASNASMGAVAVVYSFGLSRLFNHTVWHFLRDFCLEHYQLVLVYTVIFAFLGVVIVRLNIFTSPSANPTSLFQVVRWGLTIIALSLIVSSTNSAVGSLLSFLLLWLLLDLLKALLRSCGRLLTRARFRWFPPKHHFKKPEEYDADRKKFTLAAMEDLRRRLVEVGAGEPFHVASGAAEQTGALSQGNPRAVPLLGRGHRRHYGVAAGAGEAAAEERRRGERGGEGVSVRAAEQSGPLLPEGGVRAVGVRRSDDDRGGRQPLADHPAGDDVGRGR